MPFFGTAKCPDCGKEVKSLSMHLMFDHGMDGGDAAMVTHNLSHADKPIEIGHDPFKASAQKFAANNKAAAQKQAAKDAKAAAIAAAKPMKDAQAKQLIVMRIHDLEAGKEGHSSDMQNAALAAGAGGMIFGGKGVALGGLLVGMGKSEWHDAKQLRDKVSLSRCPECGGDVHKSASSCPFCHHAHRPGTMNY
jgi:endogenous inhibitor of DNA gyrase (YacG/DUF329 family)